MHANIKRLEELVDNHIALIRKLEEDNSALKQQIEALVTDRQKIIKKLSGTKELDEFKSRVRKKLLRLSARIEKNITLQDTLFPEDHDDR